jgi:hypothetical protein
MVQLLDVRAADTEAVYRAIGDGVRERFKLLSERHQRGAVDLKGRPERTLIQLSASVAADGKRDQVLLLLREIAQAASGQQAAILIDGLEKCPEAIVREIIQPILALHDEASLVIVVPTSLVTGTSAYDFMSAVKVLPIHPVLVASEPVDQAHRGRQFLGKIASRRLREYVRGLAAIADGFGEDEFAALVERAAVASGGVRAPAC